MKHLLLPAIVLLAAISTLTCQACAQTIPPINAKALDDSQVVLPKTGGSQLLVLVLGFSHKSGDNCAPWGKRLSAEFRSDAQVQYYQIPVLAGAPPFVRPMIVKGIRKGVPTSEQSRFVPVYDHESEWKKLVNFNEPDDPYIVLTRPDGNVLWQVHGVLTDPLYGELKNAIAKAVGDGARK